MARELLRMPSMNSHYKGIFLAALFIVIAFIVALAVGQKLLAFGILLGGAVLLFVFSIAYMRPAGRSPERHAKVDRIVNDTKP
ncbi:MAG TPA: hypothetical protein VFU02_04395 [Polyangiaceae bacterium]|nr:hypothetical protein [Polyangiaceae bacterium]